MAGQDTVTARSKKPADYYEQHRTQLGNAGGPYIMAVIIMGRIL
jgi:hypothetical protein